ncbi:MAG: universal stress protein [Planctomycetota bacterium]|nr:universal stress protein [Planctomycetota bacterium]MDA1177170.1 universal stress protein [Planctomycetota bacterium]
MASHRILCPVDFSAHSKVAIQYASCLAKSLNAKIYFLHVAEIVPAFEAGYCGAVPSVADLDSEEQELLQVKPSEPGLEYEHFSMVGHPAEVILEFAKAHDINLIVLGTHGRTGVLRLVMGSVAEMVVRRADCPVMTVKQPASVRACP